MDTWRKVKRQSGGWMDKCWGEEWSGREGWPRGMAQAWHRRLHVFKAAKTEGQGGICVNVMGN